MDRDQRAYHLSAVGRQGDSFVSRTSLRHPRVPGDPKQCETSKPSMGTDRSRKDRGRTSAISATRCDATPCRPTEGGAVKVDVFGHPFGCDAGLDWTRGWTKAWARGEGERAGG